MYAQLLGYLSLLVYFGGALRPPPINRRQVVERFNVHRNASSSTTPLQVGNGDFAFGADVTGLQTFSPFATMSTWGWHNFSLPTTSNQTSLDDFTGLAWWTHGRLVNYDQPNPAESDISNWLIQNPQRLNLVNIGLYFGGVFVDETHLVDKVQVLDLWTGSIVSTFSYNGSEIRVETRAAVNSDTIGISINSELLATGTLGLFFDFPFPDVNKFDAPYVGVWNLTENHSTILRSSPDGKQFAIQHVLDNTSYFMTAQWEAMNSGHGSVTGPQNGSHRYFLTVPGVTQLNITAALSPGALSSVISFRELVFDAEAWWEGYWSDGAFIDLTSTDSANATELQRRIILSQYLTAVNSASSLSPQESGLVNNGWYGKFHMEMVFWHLMHFPRWGHFDLLWRSVPRIYEQFLPSSFDRARLQGYQGARWGKMTDPSGRSAPGEINSLLIWQQPHPMYFAETQYRMFPNDTTLRAWDDILTATADFMVSFAWFNNSTGVYDLGPPMYPVSETGNPNATVNPTFELAYWRFGLDIAIRWKERQEHVAPKAWFMVRDNLAPLPVINGTYSVYEGIPNMWIDASTMDDHPAMAGIYGWLPPPTSGPPLNLTVVQNTAEKILELWDLEGSYGWDFSLLAMNCLRLGNVEQAIKYLLDPVFQFDDAGYALGGSRVTTPYMPNAASLLLTAAMMAGGWTDSPGQHFPQDWEVTVEGFVPGL